MSSEPNATPEITDATRGPNKIRLIESKDGKYKAGGILTIETDVTLTPEHMAQLKKAGFDSLPDIRAFFSEQLSDTKKVRQEKVDQVVEPQNLLKAAKRHKKATLTAEKEAALARTAEIDAELEKM